MVLNQSAEKTSMTEIESPLIAKPTSNYINIPVILKLSNEEFKGYKVCNKWTCNCYVIHALSFLRLILIYFSQVYVI